MGYSQSRVIFALITEKANTENLVINHFNILIRAAKSIDEKVIRLEVLEHLQSLKMYKISLIRYLGKGKMELFWQEIKLSIRIYLKILSCELIGETQQEEDLESGIGRRPAIVIIVENSAEASILYSRGLRLKEAIKVIEKYWKARPGLVCMSCARVGYDRLRKCGDKAL